ncbi:MAG: winged helix-turn-helix transcriptional regulator [Acidimicrobiales bacterium]
MPDTTAALSLALQRVGDRWTLLVVAALLDGPMRYGELQEVVPGIATNVLSSRLKDLERQGLVTASPYSRRPPRFEYQLTSLGAELAGVMRMLAAWGAASVVPADASSEATEEAGHPAHAVCGTPLEVRYWCPTCQQVAEDDDEVWA